MVKRASPVNAWSNPYGHQVPSNRLVASYNQTEDDFPMQAGESYLTYDMFLSEAVTIRTSAKERKAGGEIKRYANGTTPDTSVFGTILSNTHVKNASEVLQKHGLVIIKGLLPPSQTATWGEAVRTDFTSAVSRLKCHPVQKVDLFNPRSAKGVKLNYKELAVEDLHVDLRTGPEIEKLRSAENNLAIKNVHDADITTNHNLPTMVHASMTGTVDSWRFHPSVLAIIKNVFNPRTRKGPLYKGNLARSQSGGPCLDGAPQPFRLGQIGSVFSCPGSSDQDIRAETSHLFEHDICLPSHSLKIITPGYQVLRDSTCNEHEFTEDGMWTGNTRMGGMAFVYGSHKLDVAARLMSQEYSNDNDRTRKEMLQLRTIHPSLEAGDVLIFDSRTIHFKMANTSKQNESAGVMPMLYFNAWQAWFQEPEVGKDLEKIFD